GGGAGYPSHRSHRSHGTDGTNGTDGTRDEGTETPPAAPASATRRRGIPPRGPAAPAPGRCWPGGRRWPGPTLPVSPRHRFFGTAGPPGPRPAAATARGRTARRHRGP